jgi:hypothetical protein
MVDSETFRFNNRKLTDREHFPLAMQGLNDKRLTYKVLTENVREEAPRSDSEEGSEKLPN